MKIVQVNHAEPDIEEKVTAEFRSIRVQAQGVRVTVMERFDNGGVDIHVDPTNEPYNHRVRATEVSVNDIQIRIAGAHGAAL